MSRSSGREPAGCRAGMASGACWRARRDLRRKLIRARNPAAAASPARAPTRSRRDRPRVDSCGDDRGHHLRTRTASRPGRPRNGRLRTPKLAVAPRMAFDGALARGRVHAGVMWRPERVREVAWDHGEWQVSTADEHDRAPWIVGADGPNSLVSPAGRPCVRTRRPFNRDRLLRPRHRVALRRDCLRGQPAGISLVLSAARSSRRRRVRPGRRERRRRRSSRAHRTGSSTM